MILNRHPAANVLKAFVACAQDHGGILAIIGHVPHLQVTPRVGVLYWTAAVVPAQGKGRLVPTQGSILRRWLKRFLAINP